ncbi:POK9 protein, partial [Sapayoa aenigma]|nr:POK9 protein [Sapayoa aenigma]
YYCLSAKDGKRPAERVPQPRPDTNSCNIDATFCLQPATAGSLGLDLAAAVDVSLVTTRPTKIPTGVFGPIQVNGQDYGGLILGRSSVSIMGLFVLPGVIDADYTGEIQVMAHTPFPPLQIQKGQRIAQLVPLPQITSGMVSRLQKPRKDQGFGSSGTVMLTMDLFMRPKKRIKIVHAGHSIELLGLLDTGADTSIIAPRYWPRQWNSRTVPGTITGVGGFALARQTPLVAIDIDGRE